MAPWWLMSGCGRFTGGLVDEVNSRLPPYETMKKVGVVAEEWSIEGGELTPSLKLKRRIIEKKYADQIRSFYKG